MSPMPAPEVCEQARLSRDPRFDGLFFTAVRSTGIYCRPVCPAPVPHRRNVAYYPSAAAAETAGYRPCLRCRPELAPGQAHWRRGDDIVARALAAIEAGALDDAPLATLAARLQIGERQLRRLFAEHLGAAPIRVRNTRRLLFAKQLLSETGLPVTGVAMAAGFNSLRRFNAAFQQAYRMSPRELRQGQRARPGDQPLILRLPWRPPFDWPALLAFLAGRALPGIETVSDGCYSRVIGNADTPGLLRASVWVDSTGQPADALRLELHDVPPARLQATVRRVRRMFDLDTDPALIAAHLSRDPRLAPLLARRPGLRLASGWDGFEIAIRAVIGQQVSVAAARTITTRLAARCGTPLPASRVAQGFTHLFPTPQALAEADLDGIGLTTRRIASVRGIARALLDGRVDFDPTRTLEDCVARWVALPGIGPWTAQYIALRALGHPDACPAEDLVLQKALAGDGSRLSAAALRTQAEAWRPWRGYAVFHLWREAATLSTSPSP